MSNGEPQATAPPEPIASPSPDLVSVPTVVPAAVDIEEFAKAAAHLKMFEKLRDIALALTKPTDWHFFGDRPWPQRGAVEKISRALGLNLEIYRGTDGSPYVKRFAQDEKGAYYIVTVSGTIRGQWGDLEAMGFTSSRDLFFAADGKDDEGNVVYKPFSQIKEENIIQAAYTNFVANAVMRYVGISGFTRADLERVYGAGAVSTTKFAEGREKKTEVDTATRTTQLKRLWAICLVSCEGLESKAADLIEKLSGFEGKDGKRVPGLRDPAKLTPGRLNVTLGVAEKGWTAFLEKAGEKRAFYEELLAEKIGAQP